MAGVKGRSGGCNKKSLQEHRLSGTYRRDRHGKAPAAALSSTLAPAGVVSVEPPPELLTGLQAAGARFVRDSFGEFDFTSVERHVLRIAAEAYDDAAEARGRGDTKGARAAVRQFLAAMQRLGLPSRAADGGGRP